MAYGSLKLRPNEFWNLTLVELAEMHNAFIEEENRCEEADYWRTAWLASHLMNASGNMKSPMTPQKLMGKTLDETGENKEPKKKMTKAERDKAYAELKAKFGLKE